MNFLRNNFRLIIQTVIFIYVLGIGARFYFYLQALELGNYSFTKPYGVEGFLPISALLGLKQLLFTGNYDSIHPAGLTIFIAAIVMSIILKKSFCGYICPVGFVSEQVSKVGFGIKIHKFIHYPLTMLKYILLGFFVYLIFFGMEIGAVTRFINSPYNKISDAKMMDFLVAPSVTVVIVVVVLVLLTLLFKNFWCRYLCPYGALLGLVSFLSPFKVKRNKQACISCGSCAAACPMDIPVDKRGTVVSPECFGCMSCINHRYSKECLSNGIMASKPMVYTSVAIAIFLGFFLWGLLSGHWASSVSNEEYGRLLRMVDSISH